MWAGYAVCRLLGDDERLCYVAFYCHLEDNPVPSSTCTKDSLSDAQLVALRDTFSEYSQIWLIRCFVQSLMVVSIFLFVVKAPDL